MKSNNASDHGHLWDRVRMVANARSRQALVLEISCATKRIRSGSQERTFFRSDAFGR